MKFTEQLAQAKETTTQLCVGSTPAGKFPTNGAAKRAHLRFCRAIVDAQRPAIAFKPQVAYFAATRRRQLER